MSAKGEQGNLIHTRTHFVRVHGKIFFISISLQKHMNMFAQRNWRTEATYGHCCGEKIFLFSISSSGPALPESQFDHCFGQQMMEVIARHVPWIPTPIQLVALRPQSSMLFPTSVVERFNYQSHCRRPRSTEWQGMPPGLLWKAAEYLGASRVVFCTWSILLYPNLVIYST